MADIFRHGTHYYRFTCECGCIFGMAGCTIALRKDTHEFAHAAANCPECGAVCLCKEENLKEATNENN